VGDNLKPGARESGADRQPHSPNADEANGWFHVSARLPR
jgi:hypothetical protein